VIYKSIRNAIDIYLGEQECRHEYDVRAGEGWQREVFRPDGFFRALQSGTNTTRSFFVEIDLGHTSHAEFTRKIAVHRRYRESGLFREVFGEDDFSTLVITTTSKREENLFDLLKEQQADFVVLSTLQAVESGVLNPVWRKISLKEEDEISLTEGKGAIYETLL
jgi:Replication-relaxation